MVPSSRSGAKSMSAGVHGYKLIRGNGNAHERELTDARAASRVNKNNVRDRSYVMSCLKINTCAAFSLVHK